MCGIVYCTWTQERPNLCQKLLHCVVYDSYGISYGIINLQLNDFEDDYDNANANASG